MAPSRVPRKLYVARLEQRLGTRGLGQLLGAPRLDAGGLRLLSRNEGGEVVRGSSCGRDGELNDVADEQLFFASQ